MKIRYNVIGSNTWTGTGVKEYGSFGEFMYKNPGITVDHLEHLRIFKYVNVKKKHNLYMLQYTLEEE